MTTITIPRSGDAPLRFAGERIADATSQRASGYRESRWHELTIYRAASGHLVGHVRFVSRRDGEDGRDTAEPHGTDDALIAWLREYDPCDDYYGFPPGPQYAAKQDRLDAEMRAGYEGAVGEALAAAQIHESLDRLSAVGLVRGRRADREA